MATGGKDVAQAGGVDQGAGGGEAQRFLPIRGLLDFRKAVVELLDFARNVGSLGLLSWSFGIVFAGTAVGLRFVNGQDIGAPEFVSCLVFASILVLGGFLLFFLESQGRIKLVAENAVRQLAAPAPDQHGAPGSDGHGGS